MWIGTIVQLDFRAFYASIVVAYLVSAEDSSERGAMVQLMQKWMQERETAKASIMAAQTNQQATAAQRRRWVAMGETLQRTAKDRMNSMVGIWACSQAGRMTNLCQVHPYAMLRH